MSPRPIVSRGPYIFGGVGDFSLQNFSVIKRSRVQQVARRKHIVLSFSPAKWHIFKVGETHLHTYLSFISVGI